MDITKREEPRSLLALFTLGEGTGFEIPFIKRMKKRRELNALVPPHKLPEMQRTKNNSSHKLLINNQSDSSSEFEHKFNVNSNRDYQRDGFVSLHIVLVTLCVYVSFIYIN